MNILPSRDSLCIREQLLTQTREAVTSHCIQSPDRRNVIRCATKDSCACSPRNACPFLKWRFGDRWIPLHSAVYRSLIDRIINCLIGPLVAAVRMRNFIRHADLHSIKSASSTADMLFFLVHLKLSRHTVCYIRGSYSAQYRQQDRPSSQIKTYLEKLITNFDPIFFLFFVYNEKNK